MIGICLSSSVVLFLFVFLFNYFFTEAKQDNDNHNARKKLLTTSISDSDLHSGKYISKHREITKNMGQGLLAIEIVILIEKRGK